MGLQPDILSAQAFPNPVADQTTVRYDLATRATRTLTVTDLTGRKVATLATDRTQTPGSYDIACHPANSVAPGQHILMIAAGKSLLQSIHLGKHQVEGSSPPRLQARHN